MKYILIIGDGMADEALSELEGKTPLEHASTPVMDKLASAGIIGMARTVPEGMPAGSDTAILTIFGCDSTKCYGGRAPLEAAASGVGLSPGDVAYRCNMVTLEDGDMPFEEKKILSHSAGGVEGDVADKIVRDLWNTPKFKTAAEKAGMEIFPGSSFRHLAVQRNNSQFSILNSQFPLTPPHDHLGETIGGLLPKGDEQAKVLTELMKLAHDILGSHPINDKRREEGKLQANGIWFWAEGVATELPGFFDKYGKKGSVISAVPLCQGIGVLMGLDKVTVPGATGDLHTNYEGKLDAAFETLKTHDFVAVHIEAPDECTHDGDLKGKIQAIEWIDSRIIKGLTQKLSDSGIDYRMLVLSDHRTLMATRGHCGEPVPYLIYDSHADKKSGVSFCEKNAEKNGIIDGISLMELLFDDAM